MKAKYIHRAALYLITALLLALATTSQAQTNAFEAGVKAYSEADYKAAVQFFTDALNTAEGGPSAEIYYNLGAAYYKDSDLPSAILNFERAYRLNPSDQDIKFNLELAQSQQIDKLEVAPTLLIAAWWNNLSHLMSLRGWHVVVLLTFGLLILGILLYLRGTSQQIRKIGFFTALGTLGLFGLSLALMLQLNGFIYDQDEAILMPEVITITSSPDHSAKEIVVVHGGLKVRCQNELAGYTEIQLKDGTIGWVPTSSLQRINNFER